MGRSPAISFKSGAGERHWASRRVAATSTHSGLSSAVSPLPLATLPPVAVRNLGGGHPTGTPSPSRSPASESTVASQPLAEAEVPAPLSPAPGRAAKTRVLPELDVCWWSTAQNQREPGGCVHQQPAVDAHQGRLIILRTCDRSLGVAGRAKWSSRCDRAPSSSEAQVRDGGENMGARVG